MPRISIRDFFASLLVSLFTLPLSIGIALASGAPATAGWIGAVVGGLVIGLLTGVPLQISGPSPALILMVAGLTPAFGWQGVCFMIVCVGVLQSLLGIFKLADGALAISPSAIRGLLAGLGISVAVSQLREMLGDSTPPALVLGLLSLAIALAWQRWGWKTVPSPLVGLAISILITQVFHLEVECLHLQSTMGRLGIVFPEIANWENWIVPILTLTFIVSSESLICSDTIRESHPNTAANLDLELTAQGVGNVVSGLLGGFAVAGGRLLSAANIQAGATSRWAAVMQGGWIAIFAIFLGHWMDYIPIVSISGLLIYLALNLVEFRFLRPFQSVSDAALYGITLVAVCAFGASWGAVIGIGLSVLNKIRRLGRTEVKVEKMNGDWNLKIAGNLDFTSLSDLSETFSKIPEGQPVKLDLALESIDRPAFDSLLKWREHYEKSGGKVILNDWHSTWFKSAARTPPDKRIRCWT